MGEMRIADKIAGDLKVIWDKKKRDEVEAARNQFDVPNIVPAGSIELDKESDGSVLRTASGLAHTARAVAETGAGLVTGLAAFPISKGTKWIEYALSGGDLEKAKAAEQRANERIQFAPTIPEAQGALEKLGKYALDPVFKTLREAGRIPGEAWNNETMMELGGDVAEIGVPIKAHGMLKTQRAYRVKTPITEIIEPKAPEVAPKPVTKPVIVKAKSIELDKPEVKAEPKIEPKIEPVVEPKIIPAESIKLDAPEVKAEVKPVETAIDSGEPNFKTGVPVTFDYIHNTQKAPKMGSRFGQDKEPSGMYIQTKPRTFTPQENLETGTVTFNNPLVVDFGGGYGEATNWKNVLSKQYNGKTGKVLSNAIQKDGYDGIVTISKYGSSEIVKLPKADLPSAETVTPSVKPTVAEVKPEQVKTEPIKIEQKLNDEVPVKVAEVTEKLIPETKTH